MGVFASNDGEGGTMAERIALIGILCFAFAWIPVFIGWKLISVCRERHRSLEQELEAGNMPVTTNPPKPNRNSFHPGKPPLESRSASAQESVPNLEPMIMGDLSRVAGPRGPEAAVTKDPKEEHRGKRRPMPTQPVEPKMRRLPDTKVVDFQPQ